MTRCQLARKTLHSDGKRLSTTRNSFQPARTKNSQPGSVCSQPEELRLWEAGWILCFLAFSAPHTWHIFPSHPHTSRFTPHDSNEPGRESSQLERHSSQPGRDFSQPGTDSSQAGRDSCQPGRDFCQSGRNSNQSGRARKSLHSAR